MKKRNSAIAFILLLFFLTIAFARYFTTTKDKNMGNKYIYEGFEVSVIDIIDEINKKAEEEPKIEKITSTIVATGDIMFHSPQIKGAYSSEKKAYDFEPTFTQIKKYIENADLALGNFETVTAGPEHGYKGFPRFNTPKAAIEALKNTGYDILSTANNHCLDRGKEGILETIDNINEYGIKNVGTYKEATEEILIQNVNGINLAVLAYTYGCNGLESLLKQEELSYMVNIINEDRIKADIEKAEELEVDAIIVFIHWGNEYRREPSQYQSDLASKMFEWGADIILGSHPHVVQKSEIINLNGEKKYIIYSMGNFISNQRSETLSIHNRKYTEDGVIVKLTLEKDLMDNKTTIKDVNYIPTWVYRYNEGGRFKYTILPTIEYLEEKDDELSEEVINKLQESYNNTIELMDQR